MLPVVPQPTSQPIGSRAAYLLVALLAACGNPLPGSDGSTGAGPASAEGPVRPSDGSQGRLTKPPFAVAGEAEGLMLVWFDGEGVHTATRRSDIPASHRQYVRVSSLGVAPAERLDPDLVYVADLRTPGAGGSYPVRVQKRADFDALVDRARPVPQPSQAGVTLYMASWCGACRSAAAYMRSRGVDFVEKDIEKDPAANSEMQRKAKAQGKTPRGVPVIDFDGEIMLGFNQARVAQLIDKRARSQAPTPATAPPAAAP